MKLNFILNALNEETGQLEFKIDRSKDSCRTPRRNDDIESAIEFMRDLQDFLTLYMQILRRQCKSRRWMQKIR